MTRKFIQISGFKGGYTNDLFDPLSRQTFQIAKDLDIISSSNMMVPHKALGTDATDKTLNNIKIDSTIIASDGRIYLKGFDNTSGTTLTIWDAATTLNASTDLTAETVASGAGGGHGIVEFLSDLFYYESATRIQAFDIGGGAVVTNAVAVNNTMPIFVHDGLKKMFYTVAANQIGGTATTTISSTALLTLNEDERPRMATHFGRFVVIGINVVNGSRTSKLGIWDGSATALDDLIDVGDVNIQAIANVNGTIYVITASNTGTLVGVDKKIKLYRWRGGLVDLVKEIEMKNTAGGAFSVNQESVAVHGDSLMFGVNSTTDGVMGIDNGVWAYNQRTGILTLERITEDVDDINITSINLIEGSPVVTWTDGTNYRINHSFVAGAPSTRGVYRSNAFPLNDGMPGQIKRIYINHKPIPTSCGFTVAVKHFGNYPWGGTVPTEDSFTDLITEQGADTATTGKTQSTDNTTFTEVTGSDTNGNPAFDVARYAQLEIKVDEIAASTPVSILAPITLEVETEISRP